MEPQVPTPPPPGGFWGTSTEEGRAAAIAADRAANPDSWIYRESGLPGILNWFNKARTDSIANERQTGQNIKNWFTGTRAPVPLAKTKGGPASKEEEPARELTADEKVRQLIAEFAGQGSGGSGSRGPDYSAYRAALTGQAEDINARIQAMYNQLAQQAGENVGRINEVYSGAQQGIGNVYDSATGNVQQAFGSAQQQASDQLARLGIEAAAPTVINPMALSQAQAVSGLEQGRASGQAASERFGSAASGFGSQMAQVAQQQGTEMNAAVLAALQNRLNETLLMEEQGRASGGGGGGGNPMDSAMDYLRLLEMVEAPGRAEQETVMRASQIAADNTLSTRDKILQIALDLRKDYGTEDEAIQAAKEYVRQANSALGIG
jgi:hypothetical protein